MTERDGIDPLRGYHAKRHFDRTGEPRGEEAAGGDGEPAFVVQIHDARRMHFDFRLEVDGVLKSWAVPKGPSTDPGDKRLAVPTEDHPLAYRDFEGVIARGEYGAGTVMVWDQGTYRSTSHDRKGRPLPFDEALDHGHATFELRGDKLHGRYALTRIRSREERDGAPDAPPMWLLVRTGRAHGSGGPPGTPDPHRARSARTGRTLHQIATAPDAAT